MNHGLAIRDSATVDFVCLGALVHRLDPGMVPFRKEHECQIHVSGGEFNVAANLSDCFGLGAGIVTATVKYPIGDLVAERVRARRVTPFHEMFRTMAPPVQISLREVHITVTAGALWHGSIVKLACLHCISLTYTTG